MRKITSMSFAFGALVIATAPVKADSQHSKYDPLMQIGSVERQAPTAQMSNEAPHPLERFGLSSLVTQPLRRTRVADVARAVA